VTVTSPGSGYTSVPTVTIDGPGVPNTYTGPTAITAGTLRLSGSHASPVTIGGSAVLEAALVSSNSPSTTRTLTFSAGAKVRITETPTLDSYTLITASQGIVGTPTLETAIPSYQLSVSNNSLLLTTASTPTPTLTTNGTLASFSTTTGTVSAVQSFTVTGSGLTENVAVAAPAGFEVSSDAVTYGATASLTQSGGSVTAAPVYVRISASAAAGSVGGNVSVSSAGASTQNVLVSGTVSTVYQSWSGGAPLNSTNLAIYAIGGATNLTATNGVASTTAVTSTNLLITAIVRTNDSTLIVYGQSITNLSVGTWVTNDVTKIISGDQTSVPVNCQRQIFSTPRSTDTKKFLRIQSSLPVQP